MAAMEQASAVDKEVEELKLDIARLGVDNGSGKYVVKFGKLFEDPKVEQFYEALMGTLKAAKKRGVIDFKGQMLLKGAHDDVDVTLLAPADGATAPPPAPVVEAPADGRKSPPRGKSPVRTRSPTRGNSPMRGASPVRGAAYMLAQRGKSPSRSERAETAGAADQEAPRAFGAAGKAASAGTYAAQSSFASAPKRPGDPLVPPTGPSEAAENAFFAINDSDSDAQCQYFLKSFIFALKDDWKEVPKLLKQFQKMCKDTGDGTPLAADTLNHIQASDFLQKHGKTRTASERKAELNDVDINNDGRISFLEYLLLHYKIMILSEYYKRYEIPVEEDLSNDGIGLVGVGYKLVDEVLDMPAGLNPAIEAAIDEFMEMKKKREEKIKELTAKAEKGGVKGLAAKQELAILESGDETEMNRVELTLQAAKRKAAKNRGSVMLADMAAKEAAEAAKKKADAKARMAAKMAMFQGGGIKE